MRPVALAWRGLVRQPARTLLGILGVAAVGALLFDMLLLSRGLVVSFRDLLDQVGFDVRVTATEALPTVGPRVRDVSATAAELSALPEIDEVVPIQVVGAEIPRSAEEISEVTLVGVASEARNLWQVVSGRDLFERSAPGSAPAIVVNPRLADDLGLRPGSPLPVRGLCSASLSAMPPVEFRVAGIADFAFDASLERTMATALPDLLRVCDGDGRDRADLLLVASSPGHGSEAAVAAIRRARPDLHAFSNRSLVDRLERSRLSYFRQISVVLSTLTLFFAFLLITSLLTVSVNQRFGEVAALRALGFTRWRVALDLLCESGLWVGAGGLLALPLGTGLAVWMDGILRSLPGVPARLHFFVFHPSAAWLYAGLLAVTAVLAAVYPIYIAARLPIAATLRREASS